MLQHEREIEIGHEAIGPCNVREERVVEAIVHRNGTDMGAPRDHGVGNGPWKLRDAISSRVATQARSEATVHHDHANAGALRGHGVGIEAWKLRSARPARKQARSGTIVQRDEAGARESLRTTEPESKPGTYKL